MQNTVSQVSTRPRRTAQNRPQGRQDSQERWEQILQVSADLFRRKGFIGTSMQDVSDEVGLLKGSLYYYIRSKEDLLFEILKGLHNDGEKIVASVEFGSGDPLGQLRLYLQRCAVFSGANSARLVIFQRDFENIPEERRKEIISDREMYAQTVRRLIEEAQKQKMVSADLDVSLASKLISSAITSTHEWLRPKGRRPLDEAAAEIAELLTDGLTRPATAAKPRSKKA